MALQSRINEIYPSKKPFMEPADGNKRKAADLRVRNSLLLFGLLLLLFPGRKLGRFFCNVLLYNKTVTVSSQAT